MSRISVPEVLSQVTSHVGKAVFGAEEHLRLCLIAFMVRGHMLLEGPPGTGKTLLARSVARTFGLGMRRIQCTPDLMPGDVLGANIFNFQTQQFALTQGPVFTEFLLVDEINRTPPKTQSALLEAMQERSVTIDGSTHCLSSLFTVMATQNPIEHEGTYPLPEAQLDRFLFKMEVGYPSEAAEAQAVTAHCGETGMPDLDSLGVNAIVSEDALEQLRGAPSRVHVEPSLVHYGVDLARATRQHPSFAVGLSPRATTMLVSAARASAACEGREFAVPDDVKRMFLPVSRHRVVLSATAEMDNRSPDEVLSEITNHVPAPH